jgi:hypothetical protein
MTPELKKRLTGKSIIELGEMQRVLMSISQRTQELVGYGNSLLEREKENENNEIIKRIESDLKVLLGNDNEIVDLYIHIDEILADKVFSEIGLKYKARDLFTFVFNARDNMISFDKETRKPAAKGETKILKMK